MDDGNFSHSVPLVVDASNDAAAKGVVMVVENDPIIRCNLVDFLTDGGFNVLQAVDAADALMLLQHGAMGVHALVTDNSMLGTMTGVALARLARVNWPWIRLVVAAQLVNPDASLPHGCRYFQKPLSGWPKSSDTSSRPSEAGWRPSRRLTLRSRRRTGALVRQSKSLTRGEIPDYPSPWTFPAPEKVPRTTAACRSTRGRSPAS